MISNFGFSKSAARLLVADRRRKRGALPAEYPRVLRFDATRLKASSKLNDAAGECTAAPERCPYRFWAPLARKVEFISARPPLEGEKDARGGWVTSGVPEGNPSRASSMAAAYGGQGRARKPAPCVERVPHFRLKPSRSRRCPAARAAGLARGQTLLLAGRQGDLPPFENRRRRPPKSPPCGSRSWCEVTQYIL